ncbi:hypothetical protein T484DRAFT_1989946 [Baffinella frigidus]|nr:hypothetical protein T484DRAFT_1989946 [Cryptophyta sp. CCMP2293]
MCSAVGRFPGESRCFVKGRGRSGSGAWMRRAGAWGVRGTGHGRCEGRAERRSRAGQHLGCDRRHRGVHRAVLGGELGRASAGLARERGRSSGGGDDGGRG